MANQMRAIDGNEAVARIAYKINELNVIYPITPSSPMGEFADLWSAEKQPNIWGTVPHVVEMQSEAGAAGAVHGALQTGSLTTTYTASQGLLLMIPNMYKIAGELTPTVFHIAARSLAAQALSIFGDHSDVMAARTTGFAMLCSSSVQEAQDMALIAQAASLESRIPFMHFFDGFRTSHEINKIELLSDEQIKPMIDEKYITEHRKRAMTSENPFIRGTAQNPDVYFQGRETVNSFYNKTPEIVSNAMNKFAKLTGRQYQLVNYYGDPQAEKIIIIMGSGGETVRETVECLNHENEKCGILQIHLFRPFPTEQLIISIPKTTKKIAVLDRTKESGASGEPLYLDVLTSFGEAQQNKTLSLDHGMPTIIGGRYGLSSKEFTPAMVRGIFEELKKEKPKNHFTIGIEDDVTHTSLEYNRRCGKEPEETFKAMFYGLGSDGTVGANKNSIKIIGENTDLFTQAYFVYDSKKAGARTVSHLRFGPTTIRSTYLIRSANFVGCHQFNFLTQMNVLHEAVQNATFLLNSPYDAKTVWQHLPKTIQQQIIDKNLTFYVIDAYSVAKNAGVGFHINTIMQTCFFEITKILSAEKAIETIKGAIKKSYRNKGENIVKKNFDAVDQALSHLEKVEIPATANSTLTMTSPIDDTAPQFVQEVTAKLMQYKGDEIPVSQLPADGTFPSGTTCWEKRNLAQQVPVWDSETCIQCGMCSFVCPHSVIRAKTIQQDQLKDAPATFKTAQLKGSKDPNDQYHLQVCIEDCTECGLCIEACPAKNRQNPERKAINLEDKQPILETERENIKFFDTLPENNRNTIPKTNVKGIQYLQPLFEFSGACAGCGETPYLKLLTQLFGDRMLVANATGCTSIYGGNLPTTPWTKNKDNKGPCWSNSLFEDNSEFGLGFRLSENKQTEQAVELLQSLKNQINDKTLIENILNNEQDVEQKIYDQRKNVDLLKALLKEINTPEASRLTAIADYLIKHSIWIVGGDGWAYDIGYGGLDHVLASGQNVNVLVLDTQVYSNTGGQASKATPRAAIAKFAAHGKKMPRKDLGLIAMTYGYIYVAQVALDANPVQVIKAFTEAENYDGPSLIIAFSQCIAHGVNLRDGINQQKRAVNSGFWPLYRYNPSLKSEGKNPFILDSKKPSIPLTAYSEHEARFKMLASVNPDDAEKMMREAQEDVDRSWRIYEDLAK